MSDKQILQSIDAKLLALRDNLAAVETIPVDVALQVAEVVQRVRAIMAEIEENHLARWN